MNNQPEKALKALFEPIIEATIGMSPEEAADFFGQLADWAYAQSESMSLADDLEMQDYENEY